MTQAQKLARERLERDIEKAVVVAAARFANGHWEEMRNRLRTTLDAKSTIVDAVMEELRRNWTVTERARGERTT